MLSNPGNAVVLRPAVRLTAGAQSVEAAADRIVQAFLALLGEKRGGTALCATG